MTKTPTILAMIFLTLLTAACASQGPGVPALLQSWVGHPESDLVMHFGTPRRVYENPDGSRSVEFVRYWVRSYDYPCRATFTVSPEGWVTGYRMSGASAGIFGSACTAPGADPAFTVKDLYHAPGR